MYRRFLAIIVLLSIIGLSDLAWSAEPSGFTQTDRERLVRLEATLEIFMKATDKRFEQIDKRFEELRQDMNRRFEQVDKRFEQIDKRFEQMMNFMWILGVNIRSHDCGEHRFCLLGPPYDHQEGSG